DHPEDEPFDLPEEPGTLARPEGCALPGHLRCREEGLSMAERILVVAHNHPDLHPGGTEIFAHDLLRAYQRAGSEALFLGATNRLHRDEKPGTSFQGIGNGQDEILLWAGHFDRFFMSQVDLYGVIPDLEELLTEFRPDVVHIHHLLLIGAEFPARVRRVLPKSRIGMTLHGYYLMWAHDGLVMRASGRERCHGASPDRCHGCFPEVAADQFLLRERYMKTLLSTVDRFVSPSAFLRDRFIAWGLDPDRIDVIANGQPGPGSSPPRPRDQSAPRNVFGYCGNLNPWKGGTGLAGPVEGRHGAARRARTADRRRHRFRASRAWRHAIPGRCLQDRARRALPAHQFACRAPRCLSA